MQEEFNYFTHNASSRGIRHFFLNIRVRLYYRLSFLDRLLTQASIILNGTNPLLWKDCTQNTEVDERLGAFNLKGVVGCLVT